MASVISRPSTFIEPDKSAPSGTIPIRLIASIVLPLPLSPTIPNLSPGLIFTEALFKALFPSKHTENLFRVIIQRTLAKRGSVMSRRPSPNNPNPKTAITIQMPGYIAN